LTLLHLHVKELTPSIHSPRPLQESRLQSFISKRKEDFLVHSEIIQSLSKITQLTLKYKKIFS